jgi:hypothetical protein
MNVSLKKNLISSIEIIEFVNKRSALAKAEKKAGKKLTRLDELQKSYR